MYLGWRRRRVGPPRPVFMHCFDTAATAIGHVPCLLGAARRAPRGRDVSQGVDVVFAMGNPECLAFLVVQELYRVVQGSMVNTVYRVHNIVQLAAL